MQNDSVLGLKIAWYRRLIGLTQEELAERVGVSTQAVSKWEQQLSCPDILLLPELAKIFGITIDELFGIVCPKEAVYSLVSSVRGRMMAGYALPFMTEESCWSKVPVTSLKVLMLLMYGFMVTRLT